MRCWIPIALGIVLLRAATAPAGELNEPLTAVDALDEPATGTGEPHEPRRALADLARSANLSGSVTGGYWSSSRGLDDKKNLGVASLWLKSEPKLGSNASILVEGWIRNEDLVHATATSGMLREAYVDLHVGALDLRFGKQIIVWGRADRINPTDNLTPRDYTLLVPEDGDQRFGAPGVLATYHLGTLSLSGVWLPAFAPDTVPIERPPAGSRVREELPANPVTQWAVKIDQTGKRIDWSLSYFEGFDLFPDLEIQRITPAGVDLLLTHHRIRVAGADAATTLGRYGLRAEAAYTNEQETDGHATKVKQPFVAVVVGADRTFFGNLNINAQYIFQRVFRFQNPEEITNPIRRVVSIQESLLTNQIDAIQQAVSLRIARRWLNDTLDTEVAAILSLTRLDYSVRPKVAYAITDTLKVTAGADVFRGPENSFFGRLRGISSVYAELRRSF